MKQKNQKTGMKQKPVELTRMTRYGDSYQRRDKYLRLSPPIPRDTHPDLCRRKMICRRIEDISRTDHGTFRVLVQRDIVEKEYVAIDCRTILAIGVNEEKPDTISFLFEEYYTESERASLHEAFLEGEYDDIGLPEY
jgi:hypothetical protein